MIHRLETPAERRRRKRAELLFDLAILGAMACAVLLALTALGIAPWSPLP
jgi:hypothetical protein